MTFSVEEMSGAVAAELRAERARAEMTYEQLAAATGYSTAAIFRYLKGQRDMTMRSLGALCEAFGLRASDVLENAQRRMEQQAAPESGA